MNFFEPSKGDIIIKRASNGFISISQSEQDEGHIVRVYGFSEDSPSEEVAEADALYSLIYDHFPTLFQSGYKGGLEMIVHEKGRKEDV